jgi:hypothetical protein
MPFLSGARLYIAIGALVAIVVLLATNAVLWSRLGERDAKIASLGDQLSVAAGDAQRWQASAEKLGLVIQRQQATIHQLQSDGAAARAIADRQLDLAQQRLATYSDQLAKMKEAAHDRPDDVRPLGPIVLDALRMRGGSVPAGGDPDAR